MGSGKGGSTTVQGVDPYQAAQADFLFNRFNQNTPFSSLQFTPPGQEAPLSQQVGFLPQGMSSQAAQMFAPQGKGGTPGGNPGGIPSGKGGTPGGNIGGPGHQNPGPTNTSAWGTSFGQSLLSLLNQGQAGNPTTQPVAPGPQATQFSRSNPGGSTRPTNTPTGSLPFAPGTTPATATQTLPPALLALENARTTATANTLADTLGRQQAIASGGLPALTTGLDTSGMPSGQAGFSGLPATPNSPEQFRNDTINAMFQLGAEPLNRQYGRQFDQLEQSLANKGLAYPGEAASRQMSDLFREQSQGMQNLALQSVLAGGQEASRSLGDILNTRGQLTGEQQATFGQNEALRQSRLQEQVQNASLAAGSRTQQLNELNALLGLPQVNAPPIQSFLNTSPTGVMDAFGLQQSARMANAQNATNIKGSQLGGLAGLGSAAILMSDRRFKSDILKLGTVNGINIYSYTIGGERSIGVMADEVPWAAIDVNGVKMVDYARVF